MVWLERVFWIIGLLFIARTYYSKGYKDATLKLVLHYTKIINKMEAEKD